MFNNVRIIAGSLIAVLAAASFLAAQDVNRRSSYYGIPIAESGVVFLLDVSGSMEDKNEGRGGSVWRKATKAATDKLRRTSAGETALGQAAIERLLSETTKLGAARRELISALRSLSGMTEFTIITFGSDVSEWPRGMQKARGQALAHAKLHAAMLEADGGTPMAEAVELAFSKSGVRTIFLVSDGRPTTGDVRAVVRRLQEQHGAEKVVLNTIGIGKDQDKALLCSLAKDNYGDFVSDGVLTCTSNPCPQNPEIMTYFRPSNPLRHYFREPLTEICKLQQRGCTPELVYATMLTQTRFGAPTPDANPVRNCQEFILRIRGVGKYRLPDPITIALDDENLTWTNYTREGHIFHPGRIVRKVFRRGDAVYVETFGEGTGDFGAENERYGPDLFREVDERLKEGVRQQLGRR